MKLHIPRKADASRRTAQTPEANNSHSLLNIRAAIVLLASFVAGGAVLMLTLAAGTSWPQALLAGGAASSGAVAVLNQIIGDRIL